MTVFRLMFFDFRNPHINTICEFRKRLIHPGLRPLDTFKRF